jgi:FMN phosphatase YigB (HAD superfamily)
MSIELEHLTPIEKELRFSQWCKKEGIKRFFIDLDDTICPTRSVFKSVMSQAYDFLETNAPIISREKWKEEVETTNNRLFEELGVNPNRWNYTVDELTEKHLLSGGVNQEAKRIFQLIYSTPLEMLEGAEEGLEFIKKVEMPIGIVTHASKKWTWKKYNWLDLKRYLDWDDVFIVDENKHKTSESWQQAIRYFKLRAEECAVVGDSPRSDINPAWETGVRHCFLVEDPRQWSIHKQPVNPSVNRINNLTKIPDVVLGKI